MTHSLDRLAARITRIERALKRRNSPQLSNSAIVGGALSAYDGAGQTKTMQIGEQFDGTNVASPLVGPTPPVPTAPLVTPSPGGVTVNWDGFFVSGADAPMDFSRVEVHLGFSSSFDSTGADTLRGTIETPRGTDVVINNLDPLVQVFVVLRSRSLTGKVSDASVATLQFPGKVSGSLIAKDATLEQLIVNSDTDVDESAANTPPLRIGDIDASHVRYDGNEILSMDDPDTVGALGIQGKFFHRWGYGSITVTTNSSGEADISTGFSDVPTVVLVGSGGTAGASYKLLVSSKFAGGFTVRALNLDGGGTAGSGTSLRVDWLAIRQ